MVKFGEVVWYKPLGKPIGANMDTRWRRGVWLGHTRSSTEHLLGTADGVVKAYSIKRQDPDQQWNAETIQSMKGLPQQPDPAKPGMHVPGCIRFDPQEQELQQPPQQQRQRAPLRLRITKQLLDQYGYTQGCEGCRRKAANTGMAKHDHSEPCRTRLWEAMGQDDAGRRIIERTEKRMAHRKAAQEVPQQADEPGAVPQEPGPSGVSVAVPLAGQQAAARGEVPSTPTAAPRQPSEDASTRSVPGCLVQEPGGIGRESDASGVHSRGI